MSTPAQVEMIFFDALERKTLEERARFLDRACGQDSNLRHQVDRLLEAHPLAVDFLAEPAVKRDGYKLSDWIDGTDPPIGLKREQKIKDALAVLQSSNRPESLGRLAHYEVLDVLAVSNFGTVVKAFDEKLQRVVAIKLLSPLLANSALARRRFLREARSGAAVRHENVVAIYAVEDHPIPYLVTEYISGRTLQHKLDQSRPLDLPTVLRIGHQIACGLAAAHARGLVHRDIKPGNILLDEQQSRVTITDFGLARAADDNATLSQLGIIAGTPMYMAPEQALGDPIDQRADLFSLGSVMYLMCTGQQAFGAKGTLEVLKRVVEETPRSIRSLNRAIPSWLCDLVERLHAKNPSDRVGSAQEVSNLLAQHLHALKPAAIETFNAASRWNLRSYGFNAAAFLLIIVSGLGLAEATGITRFHGTVIRLLSPEGTLVIEVEDPDVSVKLDGAELVIEGAGAKEIRLKPGRYEVEASKHGRLVRRELISVAKHGRQVVRVSQEALPTHITETKLDPFSESADWVRSVSTMPAKDQVNAVAARLQQRNPGFDGVVAAIIDRDTVTELQFRSDLVKDISPLCVLTGLTALDCTDSKVNDLSSLQGMQLTKLRCGSTHVRDLSPLAGMPLEHLDCAFTPVKNLAPLRGMRLKAAYFGHEVTDLTPLKGMPLENLMVGFGATDLSPLEGMPLRNLECFGAGVSDLSPLRGMQLELLNCYATQVTDIQPLKGMVSLRRLNCPHMVNDLSPLVGIPLDYLQLGTAVTTLAPLKGMPLKKLDFEGFKRERDAELLRSITSFEEINDRPAAQFWKEVDSREL